MSKLRWSKLWWQDWSEDPALRLCSLAAQGLWMRLLCLAASADPYGNVLVGGRSPSTAQIARIIGARADYVERLIGELDAHHVLSRTDLGVIYSRRMVRDYVEHVTKTKAGSKGGNPRLKPGGQDKHVVNLDAEADAESESSPPKRPRVRRSRKDKAPTFRNGDSELLGEMLQELCDAETAGPRKPGKVVVLDAERPHGRKHLTARG
jgi:hypothetical protein